MPEANYEASRMLNLRLDSEISYENVKFYTAHLSLLCGI
jgi:hypothetical protein